MLVSLLKARGLYLVISICLGFTSSFSLASPSLIQKWQQQWHTDFSQTSIDLNEVDEGGPSKDGIPAIDNPQFEEAKHSKLQANSPVIRVEVLGVNRIYPIEILMYHEIVNDEVGGVPIAITYCPLCNSSVVFERQVDGKTLDFGTTGKLRFSDMLMYDRQTESWWQQFSGTAIVGVMNGVKLKKIPAHLESLAQALQKAPNAKILKPENPKARNYGTNPYRGYDSHDWPFLYRGDFDQKGVKPLERVVAIGNQAWRLNEVKTQGTIYHSPFTLQWQQGRASALDKHQISQSRDIGSVSVTHDKGEEVIYDLPFAFAFFAFHPKGILHSSKP